MIAMAMVALNVFHPGLVSESALMEGSKTMAEGRESDIESILEKH